MFACLARWSGQWLSVTGGASVWQRVACFFHVPICGSVAGLSRSVGMWLVCLGHGKQICGSGAGLFRTQICECVAGLSRTRQIDLWEYDWSVQDTVDRSVGVWLVYSGHRSVGVWLVCSGHRSVRVWLVSPGDLWERVAGLSRTRQIALWECGWSFQDTVDRSVGVWLVSPGHGRQICGSVAGLSWTRQIDLWECGWSLRDTVDRSVGMWLVCPGHGRQICGNVAGLSRTRQMALREFGLWLYEKGL